MRLRVGRGVLSWGLVALLWGACAEPVPGGMRGAEDEPPSRTPEALRRPGDQTYLTYPEWFLVFSPEAYADWVAARPPTDFPFLAHVRDVWAGYAAITRAIPREEAVSWGYHAMIVTIAASTTVEYAVRAAYEGTVGRLSASLAGDPYDDGQLSREDRFGAYTARAYERFLRQRAWYEFDYEGALRRLWLEVPFTWSRPLRALERRYALTSEYVFKLGYAQLLRAASHATFEEASFDARTSAVVHGLGPGVEIDGVVVEERFEDGAVLVTLPRYEAFMPAARALARAGVRFEEICGQRGRILLSVRAPRGWQTAGRIVRREPLDEARERVLFDVPIATLAGTLTSLGTGIVLEHVYDF